MAAVRPRTAIREHGVPGLVHGDAHAIAGKRRGAARGGGRAAWALRGCLCRHVRPERKAAFQGPGVATIAARRPGRLAERSFTVATSELGTVSREQAEAANSFTPWMSQWSSRNVGRASGVSGRVASCVADFEAQSRPSERSYARQTRAFQVRAPRPRGQLPLCDRRESGADIKA